MVSPGTPGRLVINCKFMVESPFRTTSTRMLASGIIAITTQKRPSAYAALSLILLAPSFVVLFHGSRFHLQNLPNHKLGKDIDQ